MLKKAYFLGLASVIATPIHLAPHTWHVDWAHAALFLLASLCLAIGLSRKP